MKNLKQFFLIAFFITAQLSFGQNKLSLKKGAKYEKITETNSITTMSMMGQDMEMVQKEKSTSLLEIITEKDDFFEFTNKLTAVQVSVEQMGQEATFDSTDDEDTKSPLATAYEEHLNKKRKIKIDKEGKVIKPENEEAQEELEEELANTQETFSIFIALPKDLSIGKNWTENQSLNTDEIKIDSNRNYEVKSIEDNLITLTLSGDISIIQDMVNQGTEVKSKLKGTLAGEVIVDKNTHVVKSEESITKMEGTTHTAGMDIPMNVNTSTHTTIEEL